MLTKQHSLASPGARINDTCNVPNKEMPLGGTNSMFFTDKTSKQVNKLASQSQAVRFQILAGANCIEFSKICETGIFRTKTILRVMCPNTLAKTLTCSDR